MSNDPAQAETSPAGMAAPTQSRMRSMRHRLGEEAVRFLGMFLYIWLWSALFNLHEWIVLRQNGVGAVSQGFAFVNALVLAKVMLVAEDLKLGRRLRAEPLIYPILGESILFSIVFILFRVAEHMVIGLFKGETVAASIPAIGGGGIAGLFSVASIYFFALLPFFAFRNVSRELGKGRLRAMLFGTPATSSQRQAS